MTSAAEFIDDYYAQFAEVLRTFDKSSLVDIADVFEQVADSGGTIWAAGNGGSAAIADHTVCDVSKGMHVEGCKPLRCVSLASNGPMITALGNDISFDQIFRKQLIFYAQPGDAALFVSSSGNSPNVVEACRYANEQNLATIAFVGFDGGELSRIANHVVHIDKPNYGIVEDIHQSLMHVLTQYLRAKREVSLTQSMAGESAG